MLNKIKLMIKRIFKKKAHPETQKNSLDAIKVSPLSSKLHFDLAKKYFSNNNFYAAWAELKTAEYLGLDKSIIEEFKPVFKSKLPKLDEMNHNQFFRFKTLSQEIYKTIPHISETTSILDVGGGHGELSSFIPDLKYCLVEPDVNGINGLKLPFENKSFDIVVSCHVLEHIPFKEREVFLDQLVSKSKKGIILLNPIDVEEILPKESMELYVDITDSRWAKEHLECGLPTISSIKDYAQKRGLKFHYTPNGNTATTMALVFFDYLSNHLDPDKYKKINKFFNTKYIDILNSEKFPNAGLFYLER